MSKLTAFCTASESNTYLSDDATWLALSDSDKDKHLLAATAHMKRWWQCDWDAVDIEDDVKQICCWYAQLDMQGKLHPDASRTSAPVKARERKKAGSLETETEYCCDMGYGVNPALGPVDDKLSMIGCIRRCGGGRIVRV